MMTSGDAQLWTRHQDNQQTPRRTNAEPVSVFDPLHARIDDKRNKQHIYVRGYQGYETKDQKGLQRLCVTLRSCVELSTTPSLGHSGRASPTLSVSSDSSSHSTSWEELVELNEEKKKLATRMRPLTGEEEEAVRQILSTGRNEVVVDHFNIEMTTALIQCLKEQTWLNGDVVNFYMELLGARNPKCHFFNSFFYTKLSLGGVYTYKNVHRWSQKANIKIIELDKVFAPIHVGGNHWCMSCINFKKKRFEYYDSLGGQNVACLEYLRQYVQDEARLHSGVEEYDFNGWEVYTPKDIPRQLNEYDCGVFACKFADYLSDNLPLKFTQEDMPYFRRRMVVEIKNKCILT